MNKKLPIIFAVFAALTAGLFFLWAKKPAPGSKTEPAAPIAAKQTPTLEKTMLATPTPTTTVEVSDESANAVEAPAIGQPSAQPVAPPTPTPPPLNKSDAHLKQAITQLNNGTELVSLLVDEEIVRKMVRAIYGISEGRVVQQFRPIRSPKGVFQAKPIGIKTTEDGQALYRMTRENEKRYSSFIAALSMVNNAAFEELYQFYLPTFDSAYAELGLNEGSFHSTLIKAINVILDAPPVDSALILVQPTVAYKYQDPELEKLSAVQKLLLRMGTENSEALKLELREIKQKLEALGI